MTPVERLATALTIADAGRALRAAILDLSREGHTKPEIYGFLEELLLQVRMRDGLTERDEDAVLDAMDALTGWCHPDAQLLSEETEGTA